MAIKILLATSMLFHFLLLRLVFAEHDAAFHNCTHKLFMVDCRNLNLAKVPDGIPNTTTVLMLSGNEIDTLPSHAFFGLRLLRTLHLANNNLVHIDKNAFNGLASLKRLELQGNQLTGLPFQVFDDVTSLEYLNIGHNRIRHLITGNFYKLKKLKNLILSYNELKSFSKNYLFNLQSLTQLDLNFNKIESFDDFCFQSCSSIRKIDLSNNIISYISENLFKSETGLMPLEFINAGNNAIKRIHTRAFRKLYKLKELDISENQLAFESDDFNGIFEHASSLETLKLNENKVRFVGNQAFVSLSSLITLNLSGNPIRTIEKGSFSGSLNLQKVYINTTSMVCDCRIAWLTSSPYDRIILANSNLTCNNPIVLRGKRIRDLDDENLVCEAQQQIIPSIVREPPMQLIATKGKRIVITVEFRVVGQLSDYNWSWVKNNSRLPSSTFNKPFMKKPIPNCINMTHLNSSNEFISQLALTPLGHSVTGDYFFVIANQYGKTVSSRKAQVIFAVPPKFDSKFNNLTCRVGDAAILNCKASGYPHPNITITKNGIISLSLSRRLKFTKHGIRISNVSVADMGAYACIAENIAGSISRSVFISVIMKPTFTEKSSRNSARVLLDEAIALECFVNGSPFPEVNWFQNGSAITKTERITYYNRDQLLVIRSIKLIDSGEYMCRARNAIGSVRRTITVKLFPSQSHLVNNERQRYLTIIVTACTCVFGTSLLWVFILSYRVRLLRKEIATISKSSTLAPLDSYAVNSNLDNITTVGKSVWSDRNTATAIGCKIILKQNINSIDFIKTSDVNISCSNLPTNKGISNSTDAIVSVPNEMDHDLWINKNLCKTFDQQNCDYIYNINSNPILRSKPLQVVYDDKSLLESRSLKDLTITSDGHSDCNCLRQNQAVKLSKGSVKDSDDEQNETSIHSSLTDISQKSLTESRLHAGSLTESALARCSESGSSVAGKLKIIQNLITEVVDGIPSTEV